MFDPVIGAFLIAGLVIAAGRIKDRAISPNPTIKTALCLSPSS
jgi:hypothetical protein